MKRLTLAMTLGLLSVLLSVTPASAQYGGEPPPAPPSGCPVEDPPPEDTPPCNPRRPASVSDDDVNPGEPVTVITPPVFAPGSPVVINIVRARNGANPTGLGTPNASSTGAVSQSVTIPDLPPGVYFVYITGTDANGNAVVSLVPIVVRGAQAAAVQGDTVQAAGVATPLPAAVAEVQTVAPETEAAVVEAVTQGATGVVLSPQGTLQVRTAAGLQQADSLPRTGGDDISQQVTIGAALMLAGTGLVLIRRRRGGFAK